MDLFSVVSVLNGHVLGTSHKQLLERQGKTKNKRFIMKVGLIIGIEVKTSIKLKRNLADEVKLKQCSYSFPFKCRIAFTTS